MAINYVEDESKNGYSRSSEPSDFLSFGMIMMKNGFYSTGWNSGFLIA